MTRRKDCNDDALKAAVRQGPKVKLKAQSFVLDYAKGRAKGTDRVALDFLEHVDSEGLTATDIVLLAALEYFEAEGDRDAGTLEPKDFYRIRSGLLETMRKLSAGTDSGVATRLLRIEFGFDDEARKGVRGPGLKVVSAREAG